MRRSRLPYAVHHAWQVFALALALALAAAIPRSAVLAQVPVDRPPVPGAPTGVTAFVDVNVVPLDSERVLPKHTVLVQNGRITVLGPSAKVRVPAGARRIDGRGQYLIPGLADMHAHLYMLRADTTEAVIDQRLFLYLANGVTTIRNMDYEYRPHSYAEALLRWRARAAAGELWVPRIYTSGPYRFPTPWAGTVADWVRLLTAYKAEGFDFFKVYDEEPDSMAAAARQIGFPFAGHVGTTLEHALTLGYASIEHFRGYDPDYLSDSATMRTIAAATQRAGVWNCPTLLIRELSDPPEQDKDTLDQWPELRYFSALQRRDWGTWPGGASLTGIRRLTKALQDAGAGLLLGTDAGGPWMVHGFSVHRELGAFVRAGLTPYQALLTGTRNVATFFHTLGESGTIAVGKRADLVLLTGNPLEDIRHTARPAGVMVGGRWLPRVEIDRRLAEIAAAYATTP